MPKNTNPSAIASVDTFFAGLEQHDTQRIAPLLAPHVVETIPLSTSGSREPEAVFDGREAVLGYLQTIVTNFSQTALRDRETFATKDGDVVFAEAKGDLVHADSGAAYHNVYVFKFVFEDGLITTIAEYANPVTFAQLVGEPIG